MCKLINKTKINNIYLLNEFTDICNLKCVMCDHGRGKKIHGVYPLGIMEEDLFEKVVERLKNNSVHLDCFHAGWLGEPLCHPHFAKLCKELFEANKVYNFFDSFTTNTNALLLNRETTDVFLDYAEFLEKSRKGFFRIHLSLHAASEKMYEIITQRPGKNLKIVLNNIDYLMTERKRRNLRFPNLTFLFVVTKINKNEAKKFLNFWSEKLKRYDKKYEVVYDWPENYYYTETDAIYFRREDAYEQYKAEQLHKKTAYELGLIPKNKTKERIIRTNAVLRKNCAERHELLRRPCPALWRTLVVHNTGFVVPCCSDLHLELKMGDLNKQSLDEIWNGPEITEMRLAHIRGDFIKYKRCFYCNNIDSFVISDEEIVDYLRDIDKEEEIPGFLRRMGKIRSVGLSNNASMNVCLVSREYPEETGWGGIGTYTYNLAHALDKEGCNVHVLAHSRDFDKEYMDGNVYVHRMAHRSLFSFKGFLNDFAIKLEYSFRLYRKLKEIIDKYDIDIVEAPNFFAEPFIYSLFKKVPLVVRLHSSFYDVIKQYQWPYSLNRLMSCSLEDAAILKSDLITCSTKAHAKKMASRLGINQKRISIISLGVPLPKLDGPVEKMPSRKMLKVLFVGRLERRKGIHILMKAIPEVLKKIPDVHFYIIGRDTYVKDGIVSFVGGERYSFKNYILRNFPREYEKNVSFLGYVNNESLSFYYKSCDLFVAPSLYETFGLVFIEAMSYAKPVVSCAVGGVPEVVRDKVAGLLVPPEDEQTLAEAIVKLLKNAELRRKMGQMARKHVEENFGCKIMAKNTLANYKNILELTSGKDIR